MSKIKTVSYNEKMMNCGIAKKFKLMKLKIKLKINSTPSVKII